MKQETVQIATGQRHHFVRKRFDPKDDIRHVFVLMLENRSFDHIFGSSGIPGIRGLNTGTPASPTNADPALYGNRFDRASWYPSRMKHPMYVIYDPKPEKEEKEKNRKKEFGHPGDRWGPGPGHSVENIFRQLTGAEYKEGETDYGNTPIDSSGFALDYANKYVKAFHRDPDPNIVMAGFGPNDLPVMHGLATEFAICDSWFCSVPGPTISNRLFAHAGTSGGVDHWGPAGYIAHAITKVRFRHSNIFKRLRRHNAVSRRRNDIHWEVFKSHGHGEGPLTRNLGGMTGRYKHFGEGNFKRYLKRLGQWKHRSRSYTFIEPYYNFTRDFIGNSQHSHCDMRAGEDLIQAVYEGLRSHEDVWNHSLLIITYDEHGGFFDHVEPPRAKAPSDRWIDRKPGTRMGKSTGFDFERYGVRVPAVLVSPWIRKGSVLSAPPGESQFDHTSILKTLDQLWDIGSFTERSDSARSVLESDIFERSPRTDCPVTLDNGGRNAVALDVTSRASFADETEPLEEIPLILFAETMREKLMGQRVPGRLLEELGDDELEDLEQAVAPELRLVLEGCDTLGHMRKRLGDRRLVASLRRWRPGER